MVKKHLLLLICSISAGSLMQIKAQTTLSGDHVITGKLNVGTSGALGGIEVKGQTGSSAAPGLNVSGDGGVVFGGTVGIGTIPATGTGARMMWFPGKAAFRAGHVTGNYWDDQWIGVGSFASSDAIATGYNSVATTGAEVTGAYSAGMVWGYALGDNSVAMARGVGIGDSGVALASGTSIGSSSVAISFGITQGNASVAIGHGSIAASYNSVVVGQNNKVEYTESYNTWVPSDPVFVVGIGSGNWNDAPEIRNRNAMVIRKSGDIEMNAKVKMPRQGDILMGEFGNSEQ